MALRLKSRSFYSVCGCFLKVCGSESDQATRLQTSFGRKRKPEETAPRVNTHETGFGGAPVINWHTVFQALGPGIVELHDRELGEHRIDGQKARMTLGFPTLLQGLHRSRPSDAELPHARAPERRKAASAAERPADVLGQNANVRALAAR